MKLKSPRVAQTLQLVSRLFLTVVVGNVEAVQLLLDSGADPDLPRDDDPTATPLWPARDDFKLHEIAALLIKAGAKDELSERDIATHAFAGAINENAESGSGLL